jgi:hypothetical protein
VHWRRWAIAGVAVWAAVVVWSTWPTNQAGYLENATSAAQDALSAAGTTLLVARADQRGDLVPPYTATTLDESREAAATATQLVLTEAVPDQASAELREQVVPLLVAASDAITQLQSAVEDGDEAGVRAASATLLPIRDRLEEFVQEHA